ncbi:MAG: aminomethyltransferase family protein, partial [Pseudomonadota bacterium]
AVFGSANQWERPNWFTPSGDYALTADDLNQDDTLTNENHAPALEDGRIVEKWSFRRSNYFEHVGNEVKNVHANAGLLDMSAFAKMLVTGPGARDWLEGLFANTLPKKQGRIALCHLLTSRGGVRSEFTVYEREPGIFYLVSAGAFELHDHDVLRKLLPDDGSVQLQSITEQYGVLVLAGPRARDILEKVTFADVSNKGLPWLAGKRINVGRAGCHALRVNFVGELGYEFHHPLNQQNLIFDTLMEAGAEFGIKPFGIRAMDAMRLEKSYRLIPRELSIEYSAYESALDRFIKPDKTFIGRDALMEWEERGRSWRFVTMEVHGVTDADARGNEAIYKDGVLVGRATSGGYGWRLEKSLALAMVKPELAEIGSELEIKILGNVHKATVIQESPFDPDNARLRAA